MFVNENGGLFNHSSESGADFLGNSRAAAYLDHDRDGDLDIVVNNFHSGAVFLRNNSEAQANNWLTLKLVGDPSRSSNRDAIGARLVLTTEGGKKVWRTIQGSTGYLSAHPKQQHFGLPQEVSSYRNCAFPLHEAHHTRHRKLRWNADAHVDVIALQMPLPRCDFPSASPAREKSLPDAAESPRRFSSVGIWG